MYVSLSYTDLNRRNTVFVFLWVHLRNTWIPIQPVGAPLSPLLHTASSHLPCTPPIHTCSYLFTPSTTARPQTSTPLEESTRCLRFHKIFFYFESFVNESIVLSFLSPTCIAHTVAIVLHARVNPIYVGSWGETCLSHLPYNQTSHSHLPYTYSHLYTKYDCSAADLNPIGGINKVPL